MILDENGETERIIQLVFTETEWDALVAHLTDACHPLVVYSPDKDMAALAAQRSMAAARGVALLLSKKLASFPHQHNRIRRILDVG